MTKTNAMSIQIGNLAVTARTDGLLNGTALGTRAHGVIVAAVQSVQGQTVHPNSERLTVLLPRPVFNQRAVRRQIEAIVNADGKGKISTSDKSFARVLVREEAWLEQILAAVEAWDGADHNAEGLAVQPGAYANGTIAVRLDETGEYRVTWTYEHRKLFGSTQSGKDEVVAEDVLAKAIRKLDRAAAKAIKEFEARQQAARDAQAVYSAVEAAYSAAATAAIAAFNGAAASPHYSVVPFANGAAVQAVCVRLSGSLGFVGAQELARVTGLRADARKAEFGGWNRWLTAPTSADFAALRRTMDTALTDVLAKIEADAAAHQAEKAAARAVEQAAAQAEAERRTAAGEILVTVPSPSRYAGNPGDVVWVGGEPLEFTTMARKFKPDELDIDTGRVDPQWEGVWMMSGWVKPVSPERRAQLLAERTRPITRIPDPSPDAELFADCRG